MHLETMPQKLTVLTEPLSFSQMERQMLAQDAVFLVTVHTADGLVGVAPFRDLPEIDEMVTVQKEGRNITGKASYLEIHPPVDYSARISSDRGAPRALLILEV